MDTEVEQHKQQLDVLKKQVRETDIAIMHFIHNRSHGFCVLSG
mgnify:CR=1 FL=1